MRAVGLLDRRIGFVAVPPRASSSRRSQYSRRSRCSRCSRRSRRSRNLFASFWSVRTPKRPGACSDTPRVALVRVYNETPARKRVIVSSSVYWLVTTLAGTRQHHKKTSRPTTRGARWRVQIRARPRAGRCFRRHTQGCPCSDRHSPRTEWMSTEFPGNLSPGRRGAHTSVVLSLCELQHFAARVCLACDVHTAPACRGLCVGMWRLLAAFAAAGDDCMPTTCSRPVQKRSPRSRRPPSVHA